MEFPELLFEEEAIYRHTCRRMKIFFREHDRQLSGICKLGRQIEGCYETLEPYFHNGTETICHECLTPCCVNRHGFPDFEDLVIFQAMGSSAPNYNFHVKDTDTCQFLTEKGCILPRCNRSYRCTWYFCDYVLDEFEHAHRYTFDRFESILSNLGRKRRVLLREFKKIWFDEK